MQDARTKFLASTATSGLERVRFQPLIHLRICNGHAYPMDRQTFRQLEQMMMTFSLSIHPARLLLVLGVACLEIFIQGGAVLLARAHAKSLRARTDCGGGGGG